MSNYLQFYNTPKFCDIWEDYNAFKTDFDSIMAEVSPSGNPITNNSAQSCYYLLYARFGNTPIANNDTNQFKYKIMVTIFTYGGQWEKKLDIQNTLRNLSETQLLSGSKQIYNHAFNPSTSPSTQTLEELEYINDQNTASNKRGYLEAYSVLWNILHANATEDFINKFKPCFKVFVRKPSCLPIYVEEDEDDE